jgi:hypothetical protein
VRWTFVPYSNAAWSRWGSEASYRRYRRYASQLTAIEHEQDWPAVRVLLERGEIDADTVFVPGHSGDFLAGSHLPHGPIGASTTSSAADWIWNKYMQLWPESAVPTESKARVLELLESLSLGSGYMLDDPLSTVLAFDRYGWRERQAKLIVNSLRVYENHGLDWSLPLWDREWVEYWSGIPIRARQHRTHALEILQARLGPLMSIPFVPRPLPRFVEQTGRLIDANYHRYGLYLGRFPIASGLTHRLRTWSKHDHPVLGQFLNALAHHMPQRLPINALTAIRQLQDSLHALDARPGSPGGYTI